jgi:hypothetical protein
LGPILLSLNVIAHVSEPTRFPAVQEIKCDDPSYVQDLVLPQVRVTSLAAIVTLVSEPVLVL